MYEFSSNSPAFRYFVLMFVGNLAYQKRTEQSSGTDSNYAVDGDFARAEICAFPSQLNNMIWWLVDFGRAYYIGEILLVGRKDCCWHRDDDLQIRVGSLGGVSSLSNPRCGDLHSLYEPVHVASKSIFCEPYGHGRYLTIARESGTNYPNLGICELSVFQIENGKTMTPVTR